LAKSRSHLASTLCKVYLMHVARMVEMRNAYRISVGNPFGKRPLGRPSGRCKDIIKIDFREKR
jgi:hypothetical protein